MLELVYLQILVKEMLVIKISVLCNYKADLRQEKWRCMAKVLGLEEEIQVTWQHYHVSVGETDRKVLDQSVMCLT